MKSWLSNLRQHGHYYPDRRASYKLLENWCSRYHKQTFKPGSMGRHDKPGQLSAWRSVSCDTQTEKKHCNRINHLFTKMLMPPPLSHILPCPLLINTFYTTSARCSRKQLCRLLVARRFITCWIISQSVYGRTMPIANNLH